MAQLSDDCFAFGGPMMSVDEAVGFDGVGAPSLSVFAFLDAYQTTF